MSAPMSLWPHKTPVAYSVIEAIQAQVCAKHGLTKEMLLSSSRRRAVTHARQESMWRCRQVERNGQPRFSLPYIGSRHGDLHHTTVLHGLRSYQNRLGNA